MFWMKQLLAILLLAWMQPRPQNQQVSQPLTLQVSPQQQQGGGADNRYCAPGNIWTGPTSDGGAQAPKRCYYTLSSALPSPGVVRKAHTDADLKAAFVAAACGDIIELDAGAKYVGVYSPPAKGCDDQHYITLRTSGLGLLPPEGTRVTPCYANQPIPPGRKGTCSVMVAAMATLENPTNGIGPLLLNATDHYKVQGIKITRSYGHAAVSSLAVLTTGHNIVFDRVWFAGIPADVGVFPQAIGNTTDTIRGLELGQSKYVAVVDSYCTDFYSATTGNGQDAQCIHGGTGSLAGTGWGSYKIVNSHLEGAGETVLFGGGSGPGGGTCLPGVTCPDDSPEDVEIRRNEWLKPQQWMPPIGGSGTGYPVTKNHFEAKNVKRVWLENNVYINNWAGFTQRGQVYTFTPKNQNGTMCAGCQARDIIVRYEWIYNAATILEMVNTTSQLNVGYASYGNSYSIHDVVAELTANCFSCSPSPTYFFGASDPAGPASFVLSNVKVDHVTVVYPQGTVPTAFAYIDGPIGAKQSGLTVTNSIGAAGTYGFTSFFSGANRCGYQRGMGSETVTTAWMNACWTGWTLQKNVIVGGHIKPWGWPSDALNYFPASYTEVFIDYTGGNYGVQTAYRNKGTDGRDLGADVQAVLAGIAGVQQQ